MAIRTRTKLAVVTAVAGLMTAQPAFAQQPLSGPVPPPLDLTRALVTDTQAPPTNVTYELKTACIGSLNDGKVVLANKPWGQQQLRIDDAHAFATGKGQVVAVIDTGVKAHPYLQDRVIKGPDYVNKQTPNALEDCDGHGTEVAGINAARSPDPAQVGFT